MKRTAAVLMALAFVAVAAQPAAADVPNPQYSTVNYGPKKQFTCRTPNQPGVLGQYGAWGYYIDGCTVRLSCPAANPTSCVAWMQTSISTLSGLGHRVTQNARLRRINFDNQVLSFRDRSCSGTNACSTTDRITVPRGQYASVQCNGIRQNAPQANWASNTCSIRMDYE